MNTTVKKKNVVKPNKVLVTGAGLLGVAAIEKFLSAGWDVVGVSLSKPKLPSGRDIKFLSVDLRDEKAARAAFEPLTDITHIAYTAIHEKPELVAARGQTSLRPLGRKVSHQKLLLAGTWTNCRLSVHVASRPLEASEQTTVSNTVAGQRAFGVIPNNRPGSN